jgi:hypothetical protein
MKPAIHESLSELIDAAQRLQGVIDAERPERLQETAALGRPEPASWWEERSP